MVSAWLSEPLDPSPSSQNKQGNLMRASMPQASEELWGLPEVGKSTGDNCVRRQEDQEIRRAFSFAIRQAEDTVVSAWLSEPLDPSPSSLPKQAGQSDARKQALGLSRAGVLPEVSKPSGSPAAQLQI